MADPLFANLPGAPPTSDIKAWAPAGGPVGAVPDTGPAFSPVAMPNIRYMSPQARHEFRQAVNAGTREAFEAWARKHADGAEAPGEGETPTGQNAEAPDDGQNAADPDVQAHAALAEKLEAHGSNIELLEAMVPDVGAYHAKLSAMSDDEMAAAFEQGEQDVIRRVFRGNEAAYEQAVRQIGDAARALGGDELVAELREDCVLYDPALFQRIWLLARNVLANRPG